MAIESAERNLAELAAREQPVEFLVSSGPSALRIVGALLLSAFVGFEIVCALLGVDFRDPHDVLLGMYKPAPGVIFRSLPGVTPIPDVVLNSEGFRGPEWSPKPQGEIRLMAIGDSTVFGYGTPVEKSWVSLTADLLSRRTGRNVTAWNFGRIGMSTEGSLADLRDFGDLIQPDALLLGVGGWNDFQIFHEDPNASEAETVQRGVFAHMIREAHSPLMKLRTWQLARRWRWNAFDRRNAQLTTQWEAEGRFAADAPDTIMRRVPPARFAENLDAMCAWARKRGIPVFYVVGRLAEAPPEAPFSPARYPIAERYRRMVLEAAERCPGGHAIRSDEALTAALAEMPPDRIWWDHVHLTAEGNGVVARAVADGLQAHWSEVAR